MAKECTCADCGHEDRSATWRNEAGLILCSRCFREYRKWAAQASEPVEWPETGDVVRYNVDARSDVHGYL